MGRLILFFAATVALAALALLAWVAFDPAGAVTRVSGWLAPDLGLKIAAGRWTSLRSIRFEGVFVGKILTVPKIELRWSWRRLRHRHLDGLRLQGARFSLDLAGLADGDAASANGPPKAAGHAWFLDRLTLERGGLVLLGIAPSLPPLSLEVEGDFRDVPLGMNAGPKGRTRMRTIELRALKVQSPVDFAHTLLYVERLLVEFNLEGLERRQLQRLRIERPNLDVDRGLFWFVDELRKASVAKPKTPAKGPPWRTQKLEITEGRLDVTRLKEVSLEYPLEFQLAQDNVDLESLSLANFRLDLVIPEQNISWAAHEIEFHHLGGRIAFNLGKGAANDLVNTIHIEQIRWKDLPLDQAWMSFTFTPTILSGAYGGRIAKGYLNGGISCGWSRDDPWDFWGAAANVDAEEVCAALVAKRFAMNGRTELKFAIKGRQSALDAALSLRSLTKGTMNIEAMDLALDKIEKNTQGAKREALRTLLGALRDYPYDRYTLEANYRKPDATLALRAEGPRGKRSLDLRWHGSEKP
ncbi:MAG: hypothetical protein IT578_08585 [Verrucomicrobiae bacterium]|nr:hypothetical protein [Verrucomicrobiae bacterium]